MKSIRQLIVLAVAFSLVVPLVSCNNEGEAQGILIIQSINQVTDPFGDVLSSSGTIPSDSIDISLFNQPTNPNDGTTGNFADIIIDNINVRFSRIDGGTDVPAAFSVPYTARIPYNGTITIENFPVMPATVKNTFPISDLITFGYERSTDFVSIRMQINLEITGKTVAEHPVFATGSLTIELTNWADNN